MEKVTVKQLCARINATEGSKRYLQRLLSEKDKAKLKEKFGVKNSEKIGTTYLLSI